MYSKNETEYKFLLGKSDFLWLLLYAKKNYPLKNDIVQINYYYDTRVYKYNKNNETVRIRQIGEDLSLQYKKHINKADNLYESEEIHRKLDSLPLKFILPYTKDIVALKGSLVTERKVYSPDNGIYLVFDYNYYLGFCDYEIEIEFEKHKKIQAEELIDKLYIKGTKTVKNKSCRFFERLNGQADITQN